jgi:hypothetical protein
LTCAVASFAHTPCYAVGTASEVFTHPEHFARAIKRHPDNTYDWQRAMYSPFIAHQDEPLSGPPSCLRGAYNEQQFRKRFHEVRVWTMAELTLETLATRLASLERKVAERSVSAPAKDWRRTVGMFEGSEFMALVDAEVLAQREAERLAARAGNEE